MSLRIGDMPATFAEVALSSCRWIERNEGTPMRSRLTGVCAVAVALTIGVAPPATAGESPSDIEHVIEQVAPEALEGVAVAATRTSGEVAAHLTEAHSEVSVVVPIDPSDGIVVEDGDGVSLAVGLPNAGNAGHAEAVSPGIVAYDNGDASTTVPVIKEDGSVQIITVIDSADAPAGTSTRCRYRRAGR
ncbi:hypothetical protein [Agromyces binzhouensis]|uniref:hypothetical protein n=1 Tax=Agromyces binzhouensis TaxID=1817495 RepID=UPI003631B6D7